MFLLPKIHFQTIISELFNSSSPNQQNEKWQMILFETLKRDIRNYDMALKIRGFNISYLAY